jgi:hypothetical protein
VSYRDITKKKIIFVRSTDTIKYNIPIVVVGTLTTPTSAYYYGSIRSRMIALSIPSSLCSSGVRSRYIDTGTLVKGR